MTIRAAPTANHVMLAVPIGSTTRITVGPRGQDATDTRKNMAPQWSTRLTEPTTTASASGMDSRTARPRIGSTGSTTRASSATTTTDRSTIT